jgi:hypothetical protein
MAEQEVEYEIDGKMVKFHLRRVKFGEWQKVMQNTGSGNVEMLGNITKGKIDTTRLMDDLMKLSVTGDRDFHDLSIGDGMDLQNKVLDLNGMGEKKSFRVE